MDLKKEWKPYALWIGLSEAVGALAGLLTRDGTKYFAQSVAKPPLTPPPAVFPVVWAALYALMGAGAARISLLSPSRERTVSLRLFGAQLGFNFVWTLLFFLLRVYGFSFLWLTALWVLILWMTLSFYELDRPAAWLQAPYLLWVLLAGYLNFGVWLLNR